MKRLWVCSAVVACLAAAATPMVGRAAQESRTSPDISGFWELNFDSRQVPRASLLPSVTRAKSTRVPKATPMPFAGATCSAFPL